MSVTFGIRNNYITISSMSTMPKSKQKDLEDQDLYHFPEK